MDVHGRISDLRHRQAEISRNPKIPPPAKKKLLERVINGITKHIDKRLDEALEWATLDGDLFVYDQQLPSITETVNLTEIDKRRDMRRIIDEEMAMTAASWNKALDEWCSGGSRPDAPVVFGFFIYKHILIIATLNASDPNAKVHIPIQLNMGEKNQHQWNALAIMVTICWARDLMMKKVEEMGLERLEVASQSDHDV